MTEDGVLLFVDAIEDDDAWLLVGETRHRVPRAILPPDAGEGAWLRLAKAPAPAEVADLQARRAHLLQADPGGKVKL
jgi:hypothetical protein